MPPLALRSAALCFALVVLSPAAAQPGPAAGPATDVRALPRGGEVLSPKGDGTYRRYVFRTLPDSTVRIEGEGGAVELPATALLRVARAYDLSVPLAPPAARAGFEVADGRVALYFSRRVPVAAVLAAFGALGALALALAVWAALRIRRDARRKAELGSFRETLATSREAERLRLARDLHDGPLQEFHAVRLGLAAGGGGPALERDLLGAIREVRRVVEDLRPPALGAYGLRAALDSLAVRFARRHPGVRIDVEVGEGSVALPAGDQLAVYRVCQEALANVAKHAGASAVRVAYWEGGGRYSLAVEDDGAGFDPSAGAPPGHYGLAGIRERAEAIGAELSVDSRPQGGVRVSVSGHLKVADVKVADVAPRRPAVRADVGGSS